MLDGQRNRLRAAQLRSLARLVGFDGGPESGEFTDLGLGGVLSVGPIVYGLLDQPGHRGLGRILAWLDRREDADDVSLRLLVAGPDRESCDRHASIVTRYGSFLRNPPQVWAAVGKAVHEAPPASQEPYREPSAAEWATARPLVEAGAVLVAEHGVVLGEVLGLEIGRVMQQDDEAPVLEIGVGKNDRAAASMMTNLRPRDELLAAIAEQVRVQRRSDASPHPLNRLARERWLRAKVMSDPFLVGAAELVPVEPPFPRQNLVEWMPAFAYGPGQGEHSTHQTLVACSVGVDVDLPLLAADARDRQRRVFGSPVDRLVLVTPLRDRYSAIATMANRLIEPPEWTIVEGDWPS